VSYLFPGWWSDLHETLAAKFWHLILFRYPGIIWHRDDLFNQAEEGKNGIKAVAVCFEVLS
jgi:hypothetical protein